MQRLGLIRALVTVGGIGVTDTRALISLLEQSEPELDRALGATMGALGRRAERAPAASAEITEILDGILRRRGWRIHPNDPARAAVLGAMTGMQESGMGYLLHHLDAHAEGAATVAQADMRSITHLTEPEQILRAAVLGTVLGEVLIAGFLRMARADIAVRRFSPSGFPEAGHEMPEAPELGDWDRDPAVTIDRVAM